MFFGFGGFAFGLLGALAFFRGHALGELAVLFSSSSRRRCFAFRLFAAAFSVRAFFGLRFAPPLCAPRPWPFGELAVLFFLAAALFFGLGGFALGALRFVGESALFGFCRLALRLRRGFGALAVFFLFAAALFFGLGRFSFGALRFVGETALFGFCRLSLGSLRSFGELAALLFLSEALRFGLVTLLGLVLLPAARQLLFTAALVLESLRLLAAMLLGCGGLTLVDDGRRSFGSFGSLGHRGERAC